MWLRDGSADLVCTFEGWRLRRSAGVNVGGAAPRSTDQTLHRRLELNLFSVSVRQLTRYHARGLAYLSHGATASIFEASGTGRRYPDAVR